MEATAKPIRVERHAAYIQDNQMYRTKPRHVLPHLLHSATTLAALLTAFYAHAEIPRLVYPGEDVVVSFRFAKEAGIASAGSVSQLRVPGSLSIKQNRGDDMIGVFSSGNIVSAQSTRTPIPVDDEAVAKACEALHQQNPHIRFNCEANLIYTATAIPNDPKLKDLYGMTKIQAPAAWDITTGSASVMVAVVDTGVQYTHPDLAPNIVVNTGEIPGNGIDDDKNGFIDDYYGYDFSALDSDPMDENEHGTHCAGTIGARGNDGVGVVGVNWTVGILPVRVLNADGSGSIADIAKGINYAVLRGARIISMSLGGPSDSATLENAIAKARAANVLIVAAAGNETSNNDMIPSYPANSTSDNVLSVAATGTTDQLASFSNFGATTVDVAAPGVNILSTIPGNKYEYFSGTSMATPMTAGVAALILAANPSLGFTDIKSIIMNTVDAVPSLTGKTVTGGRVNAYRAVATALGTTPAPIPTVQPTPEPDPDAEDPDEDPGEEDPYFLTIKQKVSGKKVTVSGVIYDSEDYVIQGENIYLVCNGALKGTTASNRNGRYQIKISVPRKNISCYFEDDYEEYSRTIKVKGSRRR